MHLSISQLSELTGRDRRTIAKQLKDLHYTAGERPRAQHVSIFYQWRGAIVLHQFTGFSALVTRYQTDARKLALLPNILP